jgi:hypothetical protein
VASIEDGRVYAGGLVKFEPKDIENIEIDWENAGLGDCSSLADSTAAIVEWSAATCGITLMFLLCASCPGIKDEGTVASASMR